MATGGAKATSQGLLEKGSDEHLAILKEGFSLQGYIDKTEERGITRLQLRNIIAYVSSQCRRWYDVFGVMQKKITPQPLKIKGVNLYHLNDWLIKPACEKDDCAFVELLTDTPQPPEWFVSHWWGEFIVDFLNNLDSHAISRNLDENAPYWVCAYANRQWSLRKSAIADDPRQTSFFKALNVAKGVVLVLNGKSETVDAAVAFTRIWCAFETATALDRPEKTLLDITTTTKGVPFLLTDGVSEQDEAKASKMHSAMDIKLKREKFFPLEVIQLGLSITLETAEATCDGDRVRILNVLAGRDLHLPALAKHPNYDKVNCRLRSVFALVVWRRAVERRWVACLELPKVLSKDTCRQNLCLDFSKCPEMTDEGLKELSRGFVNSLTTIDFCFTRCENIQDAGVCALAKGLPAGLQALRLVFAHSAKLTTEAVKGILDSLPKNLKSLRLDFGYLPNVDISLSYVGKKLPPYLEELELQFNYCSSLNYDASKIADLISRVNILPVRSLNLNLRGVRGVVDVAAAEELLTGLKPQEFDNLRVVLQAGDGKKGKEIRYPSKHEATPKLKRKDEKGYAGSTKDLTHSERLEAARKVTVRLHRENPKILRKNMRRSLELLPAIEPSDTLSLYEGSDKGAAGARKKKTRKAENRVRVISQAQKMVGRTQALNSQAKWASRQADRWMARTREGRALRHGATAPCLVEEEDTVARSRTITFEEVVTDSRSRSSTAGSEELLVRRSQSTPAPGEEGTFLRSQTTPALGKEPAWRGYATSEFSEEPARRSHTTSGFSEAIFLAATSAPGEASPEDSPDEAAFSRDVTSSPGEASPEACQKLLDTWEETQERQKRTLFDSMKVEGSIGSAASLSNTGGGGGGGGGGSCQAQGQSPRAESAPEAAKAYIWGNANEDDMLAAQSLLVQEKPHCTPWRCGCSVQ